MAFERGYIRLRLPAPLARNRAGEATLFRDPGGGEPPQTIVPQFPWVHAMRQQAEHFVAFVRGETVPLCEAEEALDDLRIAEAFIEQVGSA